MRKMRYLFVVLVLCVVSFNSLANEKVDLSGMSVERALGTIKVKLCELPVGASEYIPGLKALTGQDLDDWIFVERTAANVVNTVVSVGDDGQLHKNVIYVLFECADRVQDITFLQ